MKKRNKRKSKKKNKITHIQREKHASNKANRIKCEQ